MRVRPAIEGRAVVIAFRSTCMIDRDVRDGVSVLVVPVLSASEAAVGGLVMYASIFE